jgi:hypothetical protein
MPILSVKARLWPSWQRVLWMAMVMDGSVVVHRAFGLHPSAALARAHRWVERR